MKYSYFFAALLALLFIGLGVNFAHSGIGLGIQPNKISHTIEPGDSVSGVITLKNASDSDVKVEVEMNDFIPTPGTGDFHFVKRAEGVTSVRDWVTIGSPADFIFKKGESKEIPYTIKAPKNAEPGSHFGIAFFMASKIGDTGQLKVGTRVGMVIYVTVPGNFLQKGKLLDFSTSKFIQKGPVNFKIKFENTGTVHFEPKGVIKITNIFGKEVANVPVQGALVLPTGVKDFTVNWPVNFLLGRYKAEISLKDGEGNVLTAKSVAFYAFPLWYLASFILAVLAIFFGLKFLRKKVKFSVSLNKPNNE